MTKIQIIIFSFNRAIQLDTLLTSILKHWKAPSQYELNIIYNTTSIPFQKGYDKLKDKMSIYPFIHFYRENEQKPDKVNPLLLLNYFNFMQWYKFPIVRHPKTNFKSLTLSLIETSDAALVMFLTDDSMFIHNVEIDQRDIDWILSNPKHNQISLRVGTGMDDKNVHYKKENNYLSWNFGKERFLSNWGYRFSVDAHIYSKKTILKLFKRNIFVNPNTLEGPVCCDAIRSKWLENGRGPIKPAILSYPINMVQTVISNETLGISVEFLNDYYLKGYTMYYPIPESPQYFQQYPNHLIFEYKGIKKVIKIS